MTRILFTSQPAPGHLVAMMGVARAARELGHPTAIAAHPDLAALAAPVELLAAGTSLQDGMAEVQRRGFPSPAQPGPGAVEMFAGVTVDRGFDDVHAHARAFAADIIISDQFDFTGRLVAAAVGIPWAAHAISGGIPAALAEALAERLADQYATRSLVPRPRIGLLDPYPDLLHAADEGWSPDGDRLAVAPTVYVGDGSQPRLSRVSQRPTVLVTFGTSVDDLDPSAAVSTVLDAGLDVVVTVEADALDPSLLGDQVRAIGFVPLRAVLPVVDAVLGTGGTGTMLAALSAALPLVILPVKADQPFNAARLSACGLGTTIDDLDQAGSALSAALADEPMAARLRAAAARIAAIDSPQEALARLLSRVGDGRPAD